MKQLEKQRGFGAERKAQKALDTANAYYEDNRPQIAMYDNAERYLRDLLQERYDPKKLPPITKWREELVAKTTESNTLYRDYLVLKDETAKVEKIRRSVGEIMREETAKMIPQKSQGMEL